MLLIEVVVLHEVAGAQGLGEYWHPLFRHPLHLCHLLVGQEDAAGIDNDGIIVVKAPHVLCLDTLHLDMTGVVVEREVGLLGLQGIDDEDAGGSHIMAVDDIAAHRQYSYDANNCKNLSTHDVTYP